MYIDTIVCKLVFVRKSELDINLRDKSQDTQDTQAT